MIHYLVNVHVMCMVCMICMRWAMSPMYTNCDVNYVADVSVEGGAEGANFASAAAESAKALQQLAALGGEKMSSRLNVSRTFKTCQDH